MRSGLPGPSETHRPLTRDVPFPGLPAAAVCGSVTQCTVQSNGHHAEPSRCRGHTSLGKLPQSGKDERPPAAQELRCLSAWSAALSAMLGAEHAA